MDESSLEWLDTLGRALLWAALVVLVLAVIGAITVASSESAIPGLDELQRENRGIAAVAAIGGGLTAGGILAGLGALVRLRVAEHRRPPSG